MTRMRCQGMQCPGLLITLADYIPAGAHRCSMQQEWLLLPPTRLI